MNWEIDKKINIGNAVTALMIAMSVVWWAAHIEKRVAILEVKTEASSSSIGLYFWCHLKMGGLPNQSQHLTIKSNHFPYFTTGYILIDFECWLSFAFIVWRLFCHKTLLLPGISLREDYRARWSSLKWWIRQVKK